MFEMNTHFSELTYSEQVNLSGGGDWPGEGVIMAIFNCGKELGRAIRNALGW